MSDHIPDVTKMMQDTPRTDAEAFLPHDSKYRVCDADFARQLERELNAANDRIKRLDETLEAVTDKIDTAWAIYMQFKEPKP
jgi:ppGpp synthetase/RelA/SpoT-type nucleotidyltranferase